MGLNLMTACHVHKVKVFHSRGEESKTMMPFYYEHRSCIGDNPTTSVETLDDQIQEREWMQEYPYGYKDWIKEQE